MEAKYEKCVASNLGALRLFITAVPVDQQQTLMDTYRAILAEPKFWKMAKNKATMVCGTVDRRKLY